MIKPNFIYIASVKIEVDQKKFTTFFSKHL